MGETNVAARRLDLLSREKVVLVIPALNEEKAIAQTVARLQSALSTYNITIVVVDGNSVDKTVEHAKGAGATVVMQDGRGYGDALFKGFLFGVEELSANVFLTLDADGTYEPTDAHKLLDPILAREMDFAIGRRIPEEGALIGLRKYGNYTISWLTRRLLGLDVRDTQSGMMAFRSELIEEIDLNVRGWGINTEMLKRAKDIGMRIREIPVRYHRRIGQSKLNPLHAGIVDVAVALRMMRDTEPLLFFGAAGTGLLLVGLAIGLQVFYHWIASGSLSDVGRVVLSTLLIVVGVQLISLGLVAEMVKGLFRRKSLRGLRKYRIA
jgi:dolichol-phosphate mannosyltransferase